MVSVYISNVSQIKYKGFICNIFNCFNEENKRFSIFFSLSLFLFLSSFAFSLYPQYETILVFVYISMGDN
jgi:hypothetical protein